MTALPEINLIDVTVACSTVGCVNQGIELEVPVNADNPIVRCGPCGAWLMGEP